MFERRETPIPGAVILAPRRFQDERGEFVKTFHENAYRDLGLDLVIREEFFSVSAKDVIRGMHFQLPPHDHAKLVHVSQGRILDVILDIRKESPTFGKFASFELSAENRLLLFVPRGLAHGFLSQEDRTMTVYKTDSVYAPEHDTGIAFDSFGFDWPCTAPKLSERDRSLIPLDQLNSPF